MQLNREDIPILETARLILRAHRPDDFKDCAAMWGDLNVTRYIGGRPFSGEEVWTRMLRYAGHWAWLGFGYWAMEEKGTGRFAGELGFADYKRDIEPPLNGTPEMGWVLATGSHGRGLATEAVRAVLDWGDRRFGSARTVCLIHPENRASLRVAEKSGYKESLRTTYHKHATILFRRDPGASNA